jgi:hypothetical protein
MVSSRTGRIGRAWKAAVAACGLLGSVGCQVEYAGMTLPSGKYMYDDVQYFAPGPDFPLARTLAAQQRARMMAQGIDPMGGSGVASSAPTGGGLSAPSMGGGGAVPAPPEPAFPLGGRQGAGAPEAGLGAGDSAPMNDNVQGGGLAPGANVPTTPPNVPPPGGGF